MRWLSMNKNDLFKSKNLMIVLAIIIIIILFIYYRSSMIKPKIVDSNSTSIEQENQIPEEEKNLIIVHISGEVVNPGIVELKEGQRLYEALETIGGTTIDADVDKINLAAILEDQQKIIIPSKKNTVQLPQNVEQEKININTADKSELMTLPGIGQTIAESIIQYREDHNGFRDNKELVNVSRIGNATYEKLKDMITVY